MSLNNGFKFSSLQIILFGVFTFFISCKPVIYEELPKPVVEPGQAILSGRILNFQLDQEETGSTLSLAVPNPVTAEPGYFETTINADGSFRFEVPVECNKIIGGLNSSLFNQTILVNLTTINEVLLELNIDKNDNAIVSSSEGMEFSSDDMVYSLETLGKMIHHVSPERIPRYNMLIEDFIPFEIKSLERKLDIAKNDTALSDQAKAFITNEFKLLYLDIRFLDYADAMKLDFIKYNDYEDWDKFTAVEPDMSYYSLLEYFDLNNPHYLYNEGYSKILQKILANSTLNIPPIMDTSVEDWLKDVKKKIAACIGSDKGLFYDLLAANAYVKQFNSELKPLTDRQKDNIIKYFKNEGITKILIKKNEEIIKLVEKQLQTRSNLINTPFVPKENLMDSIIYEYKGKSILVDLWATWCAPCLDAMTANEKVLQEIKGENIVILYITDSTSPRKLWEQKIKLIEGEHYYLTSYEFNSILESNGLTGIPSYLFYDKNGNLLSKTQGYPGQIKMKEMIKDLLQK